MPASTWHSSSTGGRSGHAQSTDSTLEKQSPMAPRGLSAVSSGGSLLLQTSPILGAEAAHSSRGPAAIAPGAGPWSSADQLHGLGVPGALGPVLEHRQNRTGTSAPTVAVERLGRASSAVQADQEIPLVDAQELAVSRFPHGMTRLVG